MNFQNKKLSLFKSVVLLLIGVIVFPTLYFNNPKKVEAICPNLDMYLSVVNTRTGQALINDPVADDVKTGDVLQVEASATGSGDALVESGSISGYGGTFNTGPSPHHVLDLYNGYDYSQSVNYTVGDLPDVIHVEASGSCSLDHEQTGGQVEMNLYGSTGGSITRSVSTQLAVVQNPSVSLLVNGKSSDNVAVGSTPTLSWVTSSTNTGGSCTASNSHSDSNWSGSKNGPGGGNQVLGALNASGNFTYTIVCYGLNNVASAAASVQIIVGNASTYTCSVNPSNQTVSGGSNGSATIHISPINGYNSPISFTANFSPSTGTLPTVSFSPSSNLSPYSTDTAATISTNLSTTPRSYTITFTGTGGVVCSPAVTFVVNQVPPSSPIQVSTNNTVCGQISVSWKPATSGSNPDYYRIYRRSDESNPWGSPIGTKNFNSGSLYSYVDTTASLNTPYYYAVSAVDSSGAESGLAEPDITPVSVISCSPSLSLSDKDVIRVDGKVKQKFATTACNGGASDDVATLNNNAVYSPDDKITFQINVCNSGSAPLTSVSLTDYLTDLSSPGNFSSPQDCLNSSSDNNGVITFSLKDIAAKTTIASVCSVIFTAVVTSPTPTNLPFYRFHNKAIIHTAELADYEVETPYYLFSTTGKVPIRHETSPH